MTTSYSPSSEVQDILNQVVFAVEATNCEHHYIWKDYGQGPNSKLQWEQIMSGNMCLVGTVGSKPVMLSMSYGKLNGHLVLFYEATSVMVDHDMVRDWLVAHCPAYAKRERCDANNFHLCYHAVLAKKATAVAS